MAHRSETGAVRVQQVARTADGRVRLDHSNHPQLGSDLYRKKRRHEEVADFGAVDENTTTRGVFPTRKPGTRSVATENSPSRK
jgi:hypothetical protein